MVGQAAVQLARSAGAGRIVAAARGERSRERALALGADVAVPLGDTDDVTELADRLRVDGPVDLVVDPLFGVPAAAALRALRPHGRLVNLGSSAGEIGADRLVDAAQPLAARARLHQQRADPRPARRARSPTSSAQVRAGRLTVAHEAVPLVDVTGVWDRAGDRIVLIP